MPDPTFIVSEASCVTAHRISTPGRRRGGRRSCRRLISRRQRDDGDSRGAGTASRAGAAPSDRMAARGLWPQTLEPSATDGPTTAHIERDRLVTLTASKAPMPRSGMGRTTGKGPTLPSGTRRLIEARQRRTDTMRWRGEAGNGLRRERYGSKGNGVVAPLNWGASVGLHARRLETATTVASGPRG